MSSRYDIHRKPFLHWWSQWCVVSHCKENFGYTNLENWKVATLLLIYFYILYFKVLLLNYNFTEYSGHELKHCKKILVWTSFCYKEKKNPPVNHNTTLTSLFVKLYYLLGPYVFFIKYSFLIKMLNIIIHTMIQQLLYLSYWCFYCCIHDFL